MSLCFADPPVALTARMHSTPRKRGGGPSSDVPNPPVSSPTRVLTSCVVWTARLLRQVPLMDMKRCTEQYLEQVGVPFTVLRMCGFMQALISQYAVPILEEESVWGTDDTTKTAYLDTQVGEHSGHIQGTFREQRPPTSTPRWVNIQGTFREHPGHIQGTKTAYLDTQ
eukprot:1190243-Prorocentrum_minimum.AAC.1